MSTSARINGCCDCGCGPAELCRCENEQPQPQSYRLPKSKEKKQWYSYDESDGECVYGFQRKKRVGTKNESDAVKYCLQWKIPATERNGFFGSEEDEPDNECQPECACSRKEGQRRSQKEVTSKIGSAETHTCQCTNAYELLQLKQALAAQQAALQKNEQLTQRLLQKSANNTQKKERTHVCGCGCVSTHSNVTAPFGQECRACGQRESSQQQSNVRTIAWQTMPLSQVLDGDAGYARDLRSPRHEQGVQTGAGREGFRSPGEEYNPDSPNQGPVNQSRGQSQQSTPQQPTQQQQQQQQQQSQQQQQVQPAPATGSQSARVSSKANKITARLTNPLAGLTQEPAPIKKGLGNTALGSPFDPRELHDPNSIDIVWRRREAQKERARRLNTLLGANKADLPIIDEKQYEESMMKQHARRLKIKDFEARFQERRLSSPKPGTTTRDYGETWNSVINGKPPFAAYGNGNLAPATGGLCYGNYMLSHNISPEKGRNHPNQKQTFDEARRVTEMKRRQDKKSLRRLLESGQVVSLGKTQPVPVIEPLAGTNDGSSSQRLQNDYETKGRGFVDMTNQPPNKGITSVPQQQRSPVINNNNGAATDRSLGRGFQDAYAERNIINGIV